MSNSQTSVNKSVDTSINQKPKVEPKVEPKVNNKPAYEPVKPKVEEKKPAPSTKDITSVRSIDIQSKIEDKRQQTQQ